MVLAGLLLGVVALASVAFGDIPFGAAKAVRTGAGPQGAPSGYTPWPVVSLSDLVENGAYARFPNVGHGKVLVQTLSEMGGYTAPSDGRNGFAPRALPLDEAPSFRVASRSSDEPWGELPLIVSRNGGERDDSPGATWMPVHDGGGITTITGGHGVDELVGGCPPPKSIPIPGASVLFASGLAVLAGLGRNRLFA